MGLALLPRSLTRTPRQRPPEHGKVPTDASDQLGSKRDGSAPNVAGRDALP